MIMGAYYSEYPLASPFQGRIEKELKGLIIMINLSIQCRHRSRPNPRASPASEASPLR
jgi:hypothetical protein